MRARINRSFLLDRVNLIFSNLNCSNTSPEMQQIESEIAPTLGADEATALVITDTQQAGFSPRSMTSTPKK